MGKKRIKVFRWTETKPIIIASVVVGGTWRLATELWQVDQDITIRPTYVQGSFGIQDDPTDERINWALGVWDPDALPGIRDEAMRQAVWLHNDNWRSIGTDAGPIETTEEIADVMDSVHSAGEIEDNLSFLCMVISDINSTVDAKAIVTADIEYRQARYNNDEFDDQSEEQHAIHS